MGRAEDGGDFLNYRLLPQVVCFLFSVKKAGAGPSLAQQNIGSAGFQPVPFRVLTAPHLMHGKYSHVGCALRTISDISYLARSQVALGNENGDQSMHVDYVAFTSPNWVQEKCRRELPAISFNPQFAPCLCLFCAAFPTNSAIK